MKAAVYDEYGGPEVVYLSEVNKPEPKEDDILIEVHATTVASGDWRMRSKIVPGAFKYLAPLIFSSKPKNRILGTELSGVVAQVGPKVHNWQIGDEVFAFPGSKLGAHAEYITMPAKGRVAKKPRNLSFEEAAALCFGGSTALSFIEKSGGISKGERFLVIGASGSVGSAMVQLAKYYGAHVTGVCSAKNLSVVKKLGADEVIDYNTTDIFSNGQTFDLICDTVGSAPAKKAKSILKAKGRLLLVMAGLGDMLSSIFSKQIIAGPAVEDPKHLPMLAQLAEQGVYKPLIDRKVRFEKIQDAHKIVDSGHKVGNIVVSVKAQ